MSSWSESMANLKIMLIINGYNKRLLHTVRPIDIHGKIDGLQLRLICRRFYEHTQIMQILILVFAKYLDFLSGADKKAKKEELIRAFIQHLKELIVHKVRFDVYVPFIHSLFKEHMNDDLHCFQEYLRESFGRQSGMKRPCELHGEMPNKRCKRDEKEKDV